MRARLDEVVGPDVVAVLRSQPKTGPVSVPEPSAFGLLGRNLQPFASPDPLAPLVVDQPAGSLQPRPDLPIAVAPVATLERHPALQMTPESVAARIERAAESATRPALRNAECAAAAISDASQDLAAMLGSARTRRAQRTRLMQAGAVGVLAGLILLPLLWWQLARVLPSGFSDRIAAAVLGQAPWEAGMGLMMRANAGWWDGLAEGWRWSEAAGPELRSCYEAARTSGREQRCTVTVKPGALR